MKKLQMALIGHISKDWDWTVYFITMLVLGLCMFVNYSSAINISPFDLSNGLWLRLGYYGILYGGTYFATAILAQWKTKTEFLWDWRFWVIGLAFVFIAGLPKLHIWRFINVREQGWSLHEMVFVSKCHFFTHQMIWSLIGLAIVRFLFKKWIDFDFGIRIEWSELKPYVLVLSMVTPLIIVASFFPDFQKAYPQYKPWKYNEVFDISLPQRAAIFELCYSTGFIAVETVFRGALSITMVKIMGPRAVLAMASFYCVFHFGKPAGEAVGAFFGGYALGVLAIHSRSVFGGLIVHLGVAMLMETMGYLHHYM